MVADGKAKVYFHTDVVGTVPTDSRGCFRVRFSIPDQEFYGQFPGTRFDVHVVEYSSGSVYLDNGPGRQGFVITR